MDLVCIQYIVKLFPKFSLTKLTSYVPMRVYANTYDVVL